MDLVDNVDNIATSRRDDSLFTTIDNIVTWNAATINHEIPSMVAYRRTAKNVSRLECFAATGPSQTFGEGITRFRTFPDHNSVFALCSGENSNCTFRILSLRADTFNYANLSKKHVDDSKCGLCSNWRNITRVCDACLNYARSIFIEDNIHNWEPYALAAELCEQHLISDIAIVVQLSLTSALLSK